MLTRAMCPPGSLSDRLAQLLGTAARYRLEGGTLAIQLSDGGTMRFTRAPAAPAHQPPPPPE